LPRRAGHRTVRAGLRGRVRGPGRGLLYSGDAAEPVDGRRQPRAGCHRHPRRRRVPGRHPVPAAERAGDPAAARGTRGRTGPGRCLRAQLGALHGPHAGRGARTVDGIRRAGRSRPRHPARLRVLPGAGHPVPHRRGAHPQGAGTPRVGAEAPDDHHARGRGHAHRPGPPPGERTLDPVEQQPAGNDRRIRGGDLVTTQKATASAMTASAKKAAASDIGLVGMLRWAWRQLTTMRAALILLLVLAMAAIPGSLLPQRIQDPGAVATFIEDNGALGRFLDAVQLFDVYTSVWFSAVYILLMVSLVGCIVPRARQHYRAMRQDPPRAPRRLTRMSAYSSTPLSDGS